MNKLKTLGLCLASSLLTVLLMFSISHVQMKVESQLLVKGPTNVSKGDYPEFLAEVTKPSWFQSKVVYQWKVLHGKGVIQHRSISDNDILVPVGVNEDKLWVVTSAVVHNNYVLWGDVTPLGVVVTPVTVGVAPTPVPPDPNPPGPNPIPVTTPLWAISIFDNTNPLTLNADQLAVHNGTEDMQNSLKPLTVTWRNYDKSNSSLSNPSWQSIINQVGLPMLIIVDENGKNYYKGLLKSKVDVINQINSIRGTK